MCCYFDLSCGKCNVISLYVFYYSIHGSVCFVCCVSANWLLKQFAICLGVVLFCC